MSNRLAICLVGALLVVGFLVPALLSGFVFISGLHQSFGWPVFARLELSHETAGDEHYTAFQNLNMTWGLFFYLLFPLAVGFVAGRVSSRRRPGA